MSYQPLSEHDLARLGPAQLLRRVHEARTAGDDEGATLALQLLLWQHEDIVRAIVARRVPAHRVDDAAAHCIERVAHAIVANPPEALSEKQFRAWMATIVRNQSNEWWRRNAKHEQTGSLDVAVGEDDDTPLIEKVGDIDYGYEAAMYAEILERRQTALSEQHRRVVELRVFERRSSKEVAEVLLAERGEQIQPNTIDQIASRFRRDCRADAASE